MRLLPKLVLLLLATFIPIVLIIYIPSTAVLAIILDLIIAGLTIFAFIKGVKEPLNKIEHNMELIGQGYLDNKLNIHSKDEMGILAKDLNSMTDNLKRAVGSFGQDRLNLARERNKLSLILSSLPDAVIALDPNRNIILFNKAAEDLTGYNTAQIMGHRISEVIQFLSNQQDIPIQSYTPLKTGKNVFKDLEVKGSKISKINLISEMVDNAETHLGFILILQDISSEKQFENMKLDFVSMAAHELRTPLTSIKGYLSVFMEENQGKFGPDQLSFLNRIEIAAGQLGALIENLLSVSKIERGAVSINAEGLDWNEFVKQTVEQSMATARDKRINLTFNPSATPLPKVSVDKVRMAEVINNLLSNAIEYTDTGGAIQVSTESNQNEVVTHIKDTGRGIPKEALSNLFTKFFRVSGALDKSSNSKGTGLGLYIAKSIIELHHGKIWADSEGLGKGATFSFSLPTV